MNTLMVVVSFNATVSKQQIKRPRWSLETEHGTDSYLDGIV